jgi:predicted NAD/FAD-dependent oxidoreductase
MVFYERTGHMSESKAEIIIVGAGITGLRIAKKLSQIQTPQSLSVLEKSRGLGGRFATRRTEHSRFDHGAPFFNSRDIEPDEGIPYFSTAEGDFYSIAGGMTGLAKSWSIDLPIQKNTRVTHIQAAPLKNNQNWIVTTDSGEFLTCETLILTPPLPQALLLLEESKIAFDPKLKSIHYEKAIILLFEGDAFPGSPDFETYFDSDLHSLVNQKSKGTSDGPAFVLTFSPKWSALHFEEPDAVILEKAMEVVRKQFKNFSGGIPELKKWRYSKTESLWPEPYCLVQSTPTLILAGDAFSTSNLGPTEGIHHALNSADAVVKLLQSQSPVNEIQFHGP